MSEDMNKAAEQVRAFADSLDTFVDSALFALAPADDPIRYRTWRTGRYKPVRLELELQSGRTIRGEGEGKLEAIADAEARIRVALQSQEAGE